MQRGLAFAPTHAHMVSILTRPEGRVQLRGLVHGCGCPIVSILTRPEGRVQHFSVELGNLISMFQSSPGPRVGCNGEGILRLGRKRGFNPHPARGSGATRPSSPGMTGSSCFNPHPARGSGATVPTAGCQWAWCRFNPHPARGSGATRAELALQLRARVSILTRPEGRVQRGGILGRTGSGVRFNPHPARGSGATASSAQANRPDHAVSILTRPEGRVQPSWSRQRVGLGTFQSSPGPRVGCNQRVGLGTTSWSRVSILTRPEGRVQPPAGLGSESVSARFNPHPARGSGATCRWRGARSRPSRFNPHPARGSGATQLA